MKFDKNRWLFNRYEVTTFREKLKPINVMPDLIRHPDFTFKPVKLDSGSSPE